MDIDRFNSMVARLERESAVHPRGYRVRVALLALVGFGILGLLLAAIGFGLVALAGVAVSLSFLGGAALMLLVLKFGKLLFLLAIPLWLTLRSALKALFVRLPAPDGRVIVREQAPLLFAALDRMRAALHGPRVHRVLVVDDLNAAVVQRPAFGLVGWPRNYLLLGLPLLDCLSPDEALAVVGHEYGHLAGAHGRFSAFIYRLRHTWATVQAHLDRFQGRLARLAAALVGWYAPYFYAYTYVLARADEYRADADAAALVGAATAAQALKRANLAAPRYRRFVEHTFELARDQADPPADLHSRWAAHAGAAFDADDRDEAQRWLDEALDREGQVADTHPTLRARLAALARHGAAAIDARQLPPAVTGPTAAQVWLGAQLDSLRAELGADWAAVVEPAWRERHAESQARLAQLQALRDLPERDAEQELELLAMRLRVEPEADLRAALRGFNAAHPDHAAGVYLEGVAHLKQDDRRGLALLDRAIELDPQATRAACEHAHNFLRARGETALADGYAARWHAYVPHEDEDEEEEDE